MNLNRIKISLLLSVCLLMASCGFLDKDLDDTVTDEQILRDPTLMGGLLINIYNYIPRNDNSFNCIDGAMLDCATDDGIDSSPSSDIHNMNNGAWGPSKVIDDQWGRLYYGVRDCALFFSYIDRSNVPDTEVLDNDGMPSEDSNLKSRYKAEAKVLRALIYSELIKRFGDVPLVVDLLDPNAEELNLPRTPYAEIVDSIVKWCDEAIPYLPLKYSDSTQGRVTKGVALMVKSRTLLYAASKLNNPENNKDKWKKAADAAKEVIDLSEQNGNLYVLNKDFSAPFSKPFDPEIIFPCKYYQRNDIELNNTPNGYDRGGGRTNPTQSLVDAYEIKINGTYVSYDPQNAEHLNKRYSADRDPRLAKTVLYNGAVFKQRPVETFVGGRDGLNLRQGFTRTGYYLRKFLSEDIDLNADNSTLPRAWIFFRYAEALLNYAEAQNEYLDTPDQSVYSRLNQVRKRSMGDAGVISAGTLDKDEMRKRIRNERRVELAFEEHRFFDIRRWDEGINYFNKPVYGMKVTKIGNSSYSYEQFKVEERIFDPKMNMFPLSQSAVLKAPLTGQTKGWN